MGPRKGAREMNRITSIEYDTFGRWSGFKFEATGFFRLERRNRSKVVGHACGQRFSYLWIGSLGRVKDQQMV